MIEKLDLLNFVYISNKNKQEQINLKIQNKINEIIDWVGAMMKEIKRKDDEIDGLQSNFVDLSHDYQKLKNYKKKEEING